MHRVWLNHAATSWPKPPEVIESLRAALEAEPSEAGRGAGAFGEAAVRDFDAHAPGAQPAMSTRSNADVCRELLAQLIRASDPRRISLLPGATHALNAAIHGAVCTLEREATGPRTPGRGLVRAPLPIRCLSSCLEHNSVLRPLQHLHAEGRIHLDILSLSASADAREVARRIGQDTRLVVLTACSNVTGDRFDLDAVGAACQKGRAILVVDAAQAGGVVPIDVSSLPERSLVALAGHKGLLGPEGTGALWTGAGFGPEELPPQITGGTGVHGNALLHPAGWPLHFEAGTPNGPGIAGFAAGVARVLRTGVASVRVRRHALAERLVEGLERVRGVTVYRGCSRDLGPGIVAFNLASWEPGELAHVLEASFGLVTRAGLHCTPLIHAELGCPGGSVRASVGWSSTEDDVDALADAVMQIARSSARAA